jgi:hypothetical protein
MEDTATATAGLLSQLSKLMKNLTDDDVRAILAGDTKIMLVPRGSKVIKPLVLSEIAEQVRRSGGTEQIIALLDDDKRLNVSVLRKLADELNVPLPSAVKSKPAIQLYLAETISEYRRRSGSHY